MFALPSQNHIDHIPVLKIELSTAKFATITEKDLPVIPPILIKLCGNYTQGTSVML